MHLVLIQRGFQTEISIDLKIVILIWYFEFYMDILMLNVMNKISTHHLMNEKIDQCQELSN